MGPVSGPMRSMETFCGILAREARIMKWHYRLGVALGIIVLLGVLLYEVGRRLLASQYVSDQIASRLAKAYGGPVHVDQLDVGMHGSSVQDLRLYPADSEGAKEEPWVVVKQVTTDVSLWDAIRGAVVP